MSPDDIVVEITLRRQDGTRLHSFSAPASAPVYWNASENRALALQGHGFRLISWSWEPLIETTEVTP